jgi:hypothetical protein
MTGSPPRLDSKLPEVCVGGGVGGNQEGKNLTQNALFKKSFP